METIRAGQNVDAWCTKCKLVLAHTVEAVIGSEIKKVHCNTCNGRHQYRAQAPGESKPKASSPQKAREKSSGKNVKAKDFDSLMARAAKKESIAYSIAATFSKGALIEHKKFGMGIVTDAIDTQKIQVLFEDGPRILAQGR